MLRLDHVVVGVEDLEAAGRRFLDDHGLGSVPGGRHTGLGTGNRIVPLGETYVELVAVVDPEEARGNPFGRWLGSAVKAGGGPLAWCVATDDIDPLAGRLGLEATPWSRTRPDGTVLRWRLAGLDRSVVDPSLPFFVQWEIPPELHPGRAEAPHRAIPWGIARLEIAGHPERIREWLGGEDLPVTVSAGDPAVRAVVVETSAGEIVLRS